MSEKSDRARLEMIVKYADDRQAIVERHHTLDAALSDFEAQYAIMMCLVQIAETISRIGSLEIQSKLPIQSIKGFRNRVVHHYEGVDWIVVRSILTESIPELKLICSSLL